MRRRPRLLAALTAAALAASVPALGATQARADLTYGNKWENVRPSLRVLDGTGNTDALNSPAVAPAGPAGTVMAVVQNDGFASQSYLRVGTIGSGPTGEVDIVTPFEGRPDGLGPIAADTATGDAAVLFTTGANVGISPDLYVVTYDANTQVWSVPKRLVDGTDSVRAGSPAVIVRGGEALVLVRVVTKSASEYTEDLKAFRWAVDALPASGTTTVLESYGPAIGHTQYASTDTPFGYGLAAGVDADGVVHAVWQDADGWSGTEPIDPSTKSWGVQTAELDLASGGWSAPETLIAQAPATYDAMQLSFLHRGPNPVLFFQRKVVDEVGPLPEYAGTTYLRNTRTVRFNAGGTTTTTTLSPTADLYQFNSSRYPNDGLVQPSNGVMWIVDPASASGVTKLPDPPSIYGTPTVLGYAADGAVWVVGGCETGNHNHACAARMASPSVSGTWIDEGPLPDTTYFYTGSVLADPEADRGVCLVLADVANIGDENGYGSSRYFLDETGPDAEEPVFTGTDGSPPFHDNGDIEVGSVVDVQFSASDVFSRGDLDYRYAVDGTPSGSWSAANPVGDENPALADGATAGFTYYATAGTLGDHVLNVEWRDALGNVSTIAADFTVALAPDVTAPANVEYVAADGAALKGKPFVITKESGSDDRSSNADVDVVVNWGDGQTTTGTLASTTFSHTYASAGEKQWTVTATDEAGNVSTFGPQTVTVMLPPPPAPTNVKAVAKDGRVGLSWSATSNAALYAPAAQMVVSVSPKTLNGTSSITLSAGARSTTISGLKNGATYKFRVQVFTFAGSSPWSSTVSATPIGKPARPGSLKATKLSGGKTKLTWKAAASTGANPVAGYKVYVNGAYAKTLFGRTATAWTHSGEKKGRTYTYKVFAYNPVGFSSTVSITRKRT